jgi:predicted phage baseplate assembly protein
MTAARQLDGRRQRALEAEMRRRAVAVLSGDGRALPVGQVAAAIIGVAARIGEEVTSRLDRVPEKQADNFYAAMGIGRDPALPARVPVMFKLADPAPTGLVAPAATRLMAATDGPPVTFETEAPIALVPGTLAALWAVDTVGDRIFQPPPDVLGGTLPRTDAVRRALRSGAAAGATKVQIDPTAGLAPGMMVALGPGVASPQHVVAAIKDDVVTLGPPLAQTFAGGTQVAEATAFAPYAGSRNQQSHSLYIGHATLLDVPSAVSIIVTGVPLPPEAEWYWFGDAGSGAADWQPFTKIEREGARVTLKKGVGKLAKTSIRGLETLWLRAKLPGPSAEAITAQEIRLAVAGESLCRLPPDARCQTPMSIDFEAIAVTTPIVRNQPFYPFGREPRLFDSFYIGCAEAFSKAGAEISLCFKLGGPELGPLAVVTNGLVFQVFGVGTDGLLYRALFASGQQPQLKALPLPREGAAISPFPSNAPVAARIVNGRVEIAVGGTGAVHRAQLAFDSPLTTVDWVKLQGADEDRAELATRVHVTGDAPARVYVLFRDRLRNWSIADATLETHPGPAEDPKPVRDLIPVDGDDADPVLILQTDGVLLLKRAADPPVEVCNTKGDLPELERAAWVRGDNPGSLENIYIAGFDADPMPGDPDRQLLRLVRVGELGGVEEIGTLPEHERRPIGFERPPIGAVTDWPPTLVLATPTPTRIAARDNTLVETAESGAIGTSSNRFRRITTRFSKTVVQHPDQGLLYRDAASATDGIRVVAVPVARRLQAALAADVPPAAEFVVFAAPTAPTGFRLVAASNGDRLLEPLYRPPAGPLPPAPLPGATGRFFAATTTTGTLDRNAAVITLHGQPATAHVDILLSYVDAAGVSEDAGIWHLEPVQGSGAGFTIPPGFPPAQTGSTFSYRLLRAAAAPVAPGGAGATGVRLREVVEPVGSAPFAGLTEPLRSYYDAAVRVAPVLLVFGTTAVFALPHEWVDDIGGASFALVAGAPPDWSTLGPALPANPALSWEYWNGQSWWALEGRNLIDGTANLLVNGGVSFAVPTDIRETEVGGRNNYWIRARLVGGDYGQARITVTTVPATPPPGAPAGSATEQTIDRDLSAIRSPYVTVLDIGYCAQTLVLPEVVLTEDNLSAADQTSANQAGLRIAVFVPVGALMNPAPLPAAAEDAPAETCEDPCQPPTAAVDPSPCDVPGAYDSCDSPCCTPPDPADGAAGAPVGVVRAMLLGFDAPPTGDPVALYVDAETGTRTTTLTAEILRGGRFEEIEILDDASNGLSEPGELTLSVPKAPEARELFGVTAHWLRLRPQSAGTGWSPRLRGLFLNAATALSVETRTNESLGTSSGAPGQRFQLTGPPLAPPSLKLRVREAVSEEAANDLDIVADIAGMPGQWVLWQEVGDFAGLRPDERVYALDAQTGLLDFGDGIEGAIPPLGSELLAATYRQVTGNAGNGVTPGAELQLLSPIAGVEKVVALDQSAGGSDVEAAASARRRAAPKLRHGGHIMTLADIEDFALSRFPLIAQAHAAQVGGGVRLIVALRGRDPLPLPAFLRELVAAIRAAASFGLARPGALTAIGPRLLPLRVGASIAPDAPSGFADIAVAATTALAAHFDAAAGGLDQRGWPIGLLPRPDDIAAALDPPLAGRALLGDIAVGRAGDRAGEPMPTTIPADVLVRVDAADIRIERQREPAA